MERKFWNWKDALKSKGLKVDFRKTKVMVSRSEGELFKRIIDSSGVFGWRVMANSVLCTKCGNWIHGRCANIKKVTARLVTRFVEDVGNNKRNCGFDKEVV